MLKKICSLALLIGLAVPQIFGIGNNPCQNPPNCIVNNHLAVTATGGNVNSSVATTVNGWYVSHGTPSIFNNNAPGSTGRSIWMWSYSSRGEGMFTCYNFQQNQTYHVCLWVRNTNAINLGRLYLYAANGLNAITPSGTGGVPPVPASSQLISNSFSHSSTWVLLSYTFTASSNFTQLWIYPFMTQPPQNYRQYELQIDDIRVSTSAGSNITLSSSQDTLTGCSDSSILTVSGAPAGSTIIWSPAYGLNTTTGTTVVAKPCSTTTYTVSVSENGSDCPSCNQAIAHSVVVVNNAVASNIVNDNPIVPCGGNIDLSFAPLDTCADYEWVGPDGSVVSTNSVVAITGANSSHSGTYTLKITYHNGCVVYLTTTVTVTGCCDAFASFSTEGCNPVKFTDASSGSGTIVNWFWDFGDGNTSTLPNPIHSYAAAGTYTVCLTIVMKDGDKTCCDKFCKDIEVCPPNDPIDCIAKANFSYRQKIAPLNTINFHDLSSGSGTICGYSWTFGDGSPASTLPNPTHTYTSPGVYVVCLTITVCIYDADGNLVTTCEDTRCYDVVVQGQILEQGRQGLNTGKGEASASPDNDKPYKIALSPNPSSGKIRIDMKGIGKATVTIKNINGVIVGKAEQLSKDSFTFNTQPLAAGVYFAEIKGDHGSDVVKFVKK